MGGNHILIELPIHDPTKIGNLIPLAEAKWLIGEGYQPVLAHPERYLFLQMDDYKAFKDAGVQFQRNMGSLEGFYGEAVSARASELDAAGMYEWLGTDLHKKKYADFFDQYVFGKNEESINCHNGPLYGLNGLFKFREWK